MAHSDAEHLQPSSPKHGWHENEEIMNITASHVGDGACFRRTVSINQKQTPDRSPKRSRSDLGSNTSLAGMARAAELALKPAGQPATMASGFNSLHHGMIKFAAAHYSCLAFPVVALKGLLQ